MGCGGCGGCGCGGCGGNGFKAKAILREGCCKAGANEMIESCASLSSSCAFLERGAAAPLHRWLPHGRDEDGPEPKQTP